MAAITKEKADRTPGELKVESHLLYAIREEKSGVALRGAPDLRSGIDAPGGMVAVDITGTITDGLEAAVTGAGGKVISSAPDFGGMRATVALDAVVSLARRSDVAAIRPADQATTNQDRGEATTSASGAALSEADVTHGAAAARATHSVAGAGVKACVLSDGVDGLADRQASGDLGTVSVLTGQAGTGNEGTAMLELIYDIAPQAQLMFATGFSGEAQMAQNIVNLGAAGCGVIVDDITYYGEPSFQDGPIAKAVTTVRNNGAVYFTSAGNSGNKPDGTSGTWAGDFDDEGPSAAPLDLGGRVHGWGLTGTPYNVVTLGSSVSNLQWADAWGASANDYDLYVLNSAGTSVVSASTNVQDGNDVPMESVGTISPGQRMVITKYSGSNRFLTLYTNRGGLTTSTGGAARGHNASVDAISVAATPASVAFSGGPTGPYPAQHSASNLSEMFSSDGPVREFYTPAGGALTPGNFSSTGGLIRNGIDITAADGVVTTSPGFSRFYGTSAAAPNAAALAALALSKKPSLTPAQLENALNVTAIDIESPGLDTVTGNGIVMAPALLNHVVALPGPSGAVYVPLTPCRVVDTRIAGGSLRDREIRQYAVSGSGPLFADQGGKTNGCAIPSNALAVEASVSAVSPGDSGFFRAWPGSESMPNATFMNFARSQDITNTGAIALSASAGIGDLKVRNFGGRAQYVIDVQGYYIPEGTGDGGYYVPLTPCRMVDTRIAGGALGVREIRDFLVWGGGDTYQDQGGKSGGCGVPEAATAVEASVSAVSPADSGFFRAWPAGQSMPNATFMNFARGKDITNTGSIAITSAGETDLTTRNFGGPAQYVIDVQGYFVN